ncbi:MAG: hypothetical protein H0W85_08430 [Methylotenera sp.]|nr:hypothetical protein [Methylotenera sp.]
MQKHHRLHLQIERLYRRSGGTRFANYRIWKSSDYLLNALNIDPATSQGNIKGLQ